MIGGGSLQAILPEFEHNCSTFGCYRRAYWEQLYKLPDGRRLWLYICDKCKFMMEDKQRKEEKDEANRRRTCPTQQG